MVTNLRAPSPSRTICCASDASTSARRLARKPWPPARHFRRSVGQHRDGIVGGGIAVDRDAIEAPLDGLLQVPRAAPPAEPPRPSTRTPAWSPCADESCRSPWPSPRRRAPFTCRERRLRAACPWSESPPRPHRTRPGSSAAFSSGSALTIQARTSSSTPITPVDAGSTALRRDPQQPRPRRGCFRSATFSAVAVAQFALPAFTRIAFMRPRDAPQVAPRHGHRPGHHSILGEHRRGGCRRVGNDQRQVVLRHFADSRVGGGVAEAQRKLRPFPLMPEPRRS